MRREKKNLKGLICTIGIQWIQDHQIWKRKKKSKNVFTAGKSALSLSLAAPMLMVHSSLSDVAQVCLPALLVAIF